MEVVNAQLTNIVVVIVVVISGRGGGVALGHRPPLVIEGVVVCDRPDMTSVYVWGYRIREGLRGYRIKKKPINETNKKQVSCTPIINNRQMYNNSPTTKC